MMEVINYEDIERTICNHNEKERFNDMGGKHE